MNKQEAIAELKRMASTIEWDYPLDAQIAIEKAVEALSGPTPDPDTGCPECCCIVPALSVCYYCKNCGRRLRDALIERTEVER